MSRIIHRPGEEVSLRPCPFCDYGCPLVFARTCNRDTPYDTADRAFPIVRCSNCYAEVPGDNWAGPETAIQRWNTRAGETA